MHLPVYQGRVLPGSFASLKIHEGGDHMCFDPFSWWLSQACLGSVHGFGVRWKMILIFGKRIQIVNLLSRNKICSYLKIYGQRGFYQKLLPWKNALLYLKLQNSLKWILLIFHVTNETLGLRYPQATKLRSFCLNPNWPDFLLKKSFLYESLKLSHQQSISCVL